MARNRCFLLVLARMCDCGAGSVGGSPRGGGALQKSGHFRTPALIFNKSLTRLNNNFGLAQQQKQQVSPGSTTTTSFDLAQPSLMNR